MRRGLFACAAVAMVRRYRKVVDERLDDVMDAFNDSSEEQISEQ